MCGTIETRPLPLSVKQSLGNATFPSEEVGSREEHSTIFRERHAESASDVAERKPGNKARFPVEHDPSNETILMDVCVLRLE